MKAIVVLRALLLSTPRASSDTLAEDVGTPVDVDHLDLLSELIDPSMATL